MFAMLEFWDYVGIFVIVSFFAGGSAVYRNMKPADVQRFARLEAKLDLVLRHLGLEYTTPKVGTLSEEVKAIADQGQKIAAIKLHREQTELGLKEAKDDVEAYMDGRGRAGRPDHVLHCTRPAGAASGMIDVVRDGPGRRALRSSAEGFFPCLLNSAQPSTKSSVSFSRSPWNASASECLRRSNASLPTVARVPTSATRRSSS